MKTKPVLHSRFRGVEIYSHPKVEQFTAVYLGCALISPSLKIIRRAILRRRKVVGA